MTTLKEEEPFAVVVHTENLSKICSFCFSIAADKKTLIKCRDCHLIYYCNKKCEKGDRASHKKECCLLKRATDSSGKLPGSIVRLVARILSKSEKALAHEAFNGRTWDSLDDYSNLAEDDFSNNAYNTMVDSIVDFMRPMKIVSPEEAKKALIKVITHQIVIYDAEGLHSLGIGIYLGLSVHKHHCAPESQLLFLGTKASLRSFDPERTTYSPDIEFSYTGIPPQALNRKDVFVMRNFFECACSLCTDENHIFNRMGTSCRVSCCLNAAGLLDENSKRPYKCNKCGEASDITVKEVKRSETKIQNFLNLKKDPKYIFDLKEARRIVHESDKVLSVYNYHIINLCNHVLALSIAEVTKENVQLMRRELCNKSLKALRYYLHETDIRFASVLLDRAGLKLLHDIQDDFDVDEALEVGEKAYGEYHPFFITFKNRIENFRKTNVERRDFLFRKAGQFAW